MNFCAGCLSPRITANKPGADSHEVTNLISCDPSAKRRGFMGEYFIRPPVDISLQFSVPVDISHIKLETRLEHMCSTGFTVFTRPEENGQNQQQVQKCSASSSLKNPSLSGNTVSSSTVSPPKPVDPHPLSMSFYSCAPPSLHGSGASSAFSTSLYSENIPSGEKCEGESSSQSKSENIDDIYLCVGKYFTQSEEQLVLKNPHYRHWMNIPVPELGGLNQGFRTYKGTLRHPNRLALRCVKVVIIRILKTSEKGPPVLRSVEIWGQPGISTGKLERKELLKKWASRRKIDESLPHVPRMYNSYPEENKREIPVDEAVKTQDLPEVPEDFLDPLTCDMMTVPLLLPSGHSIDAHTLERFIANEAIWGRPASDPFTGVPFKEGLNPRPNVPLKARIDRFLVLNADLPVVQRAARTVGSTHSFSKQGDSNRVNSKTGMNINHPPLTNCRKRKNEESMRPGDPNDLVQLEEIAEEYKNDELSAEEREVLTKQAGESSVETDEGPGDTLEAEIEAVLKGKPKYVPMNKNECSLGDSYKREAKNISEKMPIKCRPTLAKSNASRVRLQTVNHTVNLMKRPTPASNVCGKTTSGRHGLVHMIGGALSVTHGRAVKASSIPFHCPSAKPTSLVRGDCKPQQFDLALHSLVNCSCGEKEGLYKLPCAHIMCRTCLIQQTTGPEVECNVCKIMCKRVDISKHHEKSMFS